jgi:hypothetical protein
MLQINSIYNKDLDDALSYFREQGEWPDWMLSEEYYDYLFKPWLIKKNPRALQGQKWWFQLAFLKKLL